MTSYVVVYCETQQEIFTEREGRGAGEARRRKPTRECVRANVIGLNMEVAAAI